MAKFKCISKIQNSDTGNFNVGFTPVDSQMFDMEAFTLNTPNNAIYFNAMLENVAERFEVGSQYDISIS